MSITYSTTSPGGGSVLFSTTYSSTLSLSGKVGALTTNYGSMLVLTATSLVSLFPSNAFTIEFNVWFAPQGTPTVNQTLFTASNGTGTYIGINIDAFNNSGTTGGYAEFWLTGPTTVNQTSSYTRYVYVTPNGWTNSTWHHVAMVSNGTTIYGFMDGVLQGSYTQTLIPSQWVNTWSFGGQNDRSQGNYTQGAFANFRVSNIARYTSSFTAPTSYFTSDGNTVYLNTFNQSSGSSWSSTAYTMSIPCLCKGMLLRTPYGDTPVEKLRIGDLIITQDGRTVPIVDTVRSVVRGDYYNIPFRIPAHHFAENAPYADVLVSPNHIVYYDKVIVPCQTSGFTDETTLLGKDFEYFNVALPNYATDKMVCQGLEVDSWNTKSKLLY